jgi:undecaprenyl-diphosphatase
MTAVFNPVPGRQWLELDERLCICFNRAARHGTVRQIFRIVSRLGNGVFWYVLMGALLAIHGVAAVGVVLHMAAVGFMCTLLYKCLKAKTSRPRPYQVNQAITCNARPLDPFSFPSGHTLHAVAFTTIASVYYPQLSWLLIPLTLLIALSRMVLGLHYPSDVLAGIAIGAIVAGISLPLKSLVLS